MTARTYGRIILTRSEGTPQWEMDLEAHVAMRLKRVFGRIGSQKRGLLYVTACPATSRDLVWILTRYPVEMSRKDRKLLQEQAVEHDRSAEELHNVLTGATNPRPFELELPLREYQAQAAEATLLRAGMLVADDVGLGKTAVGIAVIANEPRLRPALVVTLTHLTKQWQREFTKFVPGLRTHIAKKGTPYPLGVSAKAPEGQIALIDDSPDVIIMNYAKLAGWAGSLAGKVRSVVFDECQELRRTGSNKYHAADLIARRALLRLGLSATPIYNYGGEFHNVFEVLRPGSLGTWSEFHTEWCEASIQRDKAIVKDPKAFGAYVRDEGIMLRRTRTDVERELPSLSVIPHHVDSDADALLKGDDAISELCKMVLSEAGGLERGARMRAAGEFDWKLRRATGLSKAPYVARFVDLLLESGEQVVLYGWHHTVYDVWKNELARWDPVFFTGQESVAKKEAARIAFMEGRSKVLCMSLRAGAGLDGLQHACATVVFGELDWSPQVHAQCIGRVHRDGQKRPVAAYYLVADEGSDPVVSDVLGLKRAQSEPVLDPDAPLAQPVVNLDRVRTLAADYASRHGINVNTPLGGTETMAP